MKIYQHNDDNCSLQECITYNSLHSNYLNMYFKIQTLSKYLDVSVSTIYKWTAKNEIPFSKIRGALRFKKDEIDLWLEKYHYKDKGHYGLK